MKALKSKSLMSLIYAVLLALPLCAILSRVIYVQSNKNAYQSYYGETINEKQYTQETPNDLHINDYCRYYQNPTIPINSGWQDYFISGEDYEITSAPTTTIDASNIKYFGFYAGTTRQSLLFYSSDFTLVYEYYFDNSIALTFNFNYIENYKRYNFGNNDILTDNNFIYKITFNKDSYLDNVFEYSVSQFVSENDFGQLNFFQWYDELLLSNNSHNALYIHFANWYLNYAMLISLMQILFLVLMWFVNFARKLLDRGMNYDW